MRRSCSASARQPAGPCGSARRTAPCGSVAGLLAGAGIVAALGLVHDLKPFRAALRLPVQTTAAVLVVCLAGLSPAAGVLAVLWIVLVTNAFALLDHADGLLTTVGLVTAAGLLACAALGGDPALTLLPATLVAGLVSFLLHNWHPARLRLGASGAQFTGFALAASGALIQEAAPSGRAAWAALPVLATVALADTALVLISRRRAARSLLRDTDDHIAHRLRRVRVTVPGTAVLLGLWAAVPVTTATLVYAELLHPAFLLLPLGRVRGRRVRPAEDSGVHTAPYRLPAHHGTHHRRRRDPLRRLRTGCHGPGSREG